MEFDQIANVYRLQRPGIPPALSEWLVDLSVKARAITVVEIGCGPAYVLHKFSSHAEKLIAIDRSREMLTIVSRQIKKAHTIQALGEALPLRDRTANLVVFCRSIHLMDRVLALREAVRISLPEGLITVITENPHKGKYTAADFSAEIQKLRTQSRARYPTAEELLRAAGLAHLTLASLRSFEISVTYTREEYVSYHYLRPFSYTFKLQPEIWRTLVSDLDSALRKDNENRVVADRFVYDCYCFRCALN